MQNIKVATPDVICKDVLIFTTPEHLNFLNIDGLFLQDIDYTQDIAGCIDKHKFINYLISRHRFHLEEDINKGETHLRILNNDHTTGRHCLTFLVEWGRMVLRVKFLE